VQDRGELVERNREHLVADVGETLWRRQRLEHDEPREAGRVGGQRLVFRGDAVGTVGHRVRQACLERFPASRSA
jgi:hypothetical protein